jgi:DNA helicase-2/ATP-dependent DNA helicase PcrA
MIDFQKELNTEQLNVVLHGDGPCLVLAGAGSGKTRAITYRVAYLLEQGIDPASILLLTFTNKAAKEMMHRVSLIASDGVKLPWSGTFHHVAYRILKKYAAVLGYTHTFNILDSEDARDMLKLCVAHEGVDRSNKRFPSPAVITALLSFARNAERTIADVLEEKHPQWAEHAPALVRIAETYRRKKLEANVMDFDDLLVNLFLLLSSSVQVRTLYATQFQYILVDEYQDTNKIQASIIRLLASVNKNILVVGDDAQSIYSFRAADIANILEFEQQYPGAHIFRLETNYRSTPDILTVANEVIAQNTKQYKKELKSTREPFTKPEIHAFVDVHEEARFIAERILELSEEGVPLSEVAVLFRAAFHSQSLEIELTRRGIPYDYRGGVRFFERAHVKDVISFLRVYANRGDTIAWMRVLTMQTGIGPAAAEKIIARVKDFSPDAPIDHAGSVLSSRGQPGWGEFIRIWNEMSAATLRGIGEMIRGILASPYTQYLEAEYPDYRERVQDIEQLALYADQYQMRDGELRLSEFLAEASLQESYTGTTTRSTDDDTQKIVLSTIHQAKGLEWEAVFVLHVAAGQFPSERSMREIDGVEEERRLFYVAITRAKKFLYLSYPLLASAFSVLQGPSPFIEEIDRDLVQYERSYGTDSLVFSDPSDDVDNITYEAEDEARPTRSFLKSLDDL